MGSKSPVKEACLARYRYAVVLEAPGAKRVRLRRSERPKPRGDNTPPLPAAVCGMSRDSRMLVIRR